VKLKPLLLLAAAFALAFVSHDLELRGDAAPIVAGGGVSGARLTWHLSALVLLLAALGCFILAALSLFRGRG
jgi:hypothetical protein